MKQIWIDISHWETENGGTKKHVPFDWGKFRAAGGSNATIRCCYMATPLLRTAKMALDAQYLANVQDAIDAKVNPLYYLLLEMKPGTGRAQIDFYLANTDLKGNPGMIDAELNGAMTKTEVRDTFEYLEFKTGQIPVWYSNMAWIKKYLKPLDTWARHYKLLYANYNNLAYPAVPLPWFPSDPIGIQFSQSIHAPAYGVANGNLGAALYEMNL